MGGELPKMKLSEMSPARRRAWKSLIATDRQGKVATTIERARAYLEAYPDDGYVWLILGGALHQVARYGESARALRRSIKLLPPVHLDLSYAELGHLYRNKGNNRAAERWYRKAVSLNRKPENIVFLGSVLARQGRYADAKRQYRRVVRLDAAVVDEAYFNLGLIFRAEANYEEALHCFDQALRVDPKYAEARRARRDVLHAAKSRR